MLLHKKKQKTIKNKHIQTNARKVETLSAQMLENLYQKGQGWAPGVGAVPSLTIVGTNDRQL